MANLAKYVLWSPAIKANAAAFVSQLETDERKPVEVVVREYKKRRTDPQLRTLWMWHQEVASELSIRTSKRWSREDVHDVVFKPRFMPSDEVELPDGTAVHRPLGTSHPEVSREQVTDAMEAYMAWCYSMGIEITVPEAA